jgi:hypothetical protein
MTEKLSSKIMTGAYGYLGQGCPASSHREAAFLKKTTSYGIDNKVFTLHILSFIFRQIQQHIVVSDGQ